MGNWDYNPTYRGCNFIFNVPVICVRRNKALVLLKDLYVYPPAPKKNKHYGTLVQCQGENHSYREG